MRAVFVGTKADSLDPLIDQTSILPRAQVRRAIDPARENIIVDASASPLKPSHQACTSVRHQFELDRTSCLLLDHDRPRSNLGTRDQSSDLDLHQIAAAQLAIDSKVQKCSVTRAPFSI